MRPTPRRSEGPLQISSVSVAADGPCAGLCGSSRRSCLVSLCRSTSSVVTLSARMGCRAASAARRPSPDISTETIGTRCLCSSSWYPLASRLLKKALFQLACEALAGLPECGILGQPEPGGQNTIESRIASMMPAQTVLRLRFEKTSLIGCAKALNAGGTRPTAGQRRASNCRQRGWSAQLSGSRSRRRKRTGPLDRRCRPRSRRSNRSGPDRHESARSCRTSGTSCGPTFSTCISSAGSTISKTEPPRHSISALAISPAIGVAIVASSVPVRSTWAI